MSIAEHVTGLQHLGLPTAALDETAAFYESLGFVRAHSTVNPGTGSGCAFSPAAACASKPTSAPRPPAGPEPSTTWPWTWTTLSPPGRKCGWPAWPPLEDAIQFLPFWENGVRFFNLLGPNGETVEFSQRL